MELAVLLERLISRTKAGGSDVLRLYGRRSNDGGRENTGIDGRIDIDERPDMDID